MTTRKAIWFFVSLAAIAALAVAFSFPARAGKIHGSSNAVGGLYTTETDRLIVGSNTIFGGGNPQIQVQSATAQPVFSLQSFNGVAAPSIKLGVSSGALGAMGLPAVCCGGVYWTPNDGTNEITAGHISLALSTTATAGSIPTKLLFYNTPVGAVEDTLHATLDASGRWVLNSLGYPPAMSGYYPKSFVSTGAEGSFGAVRYSNDTGGAIVTLGKSRSGTDGTNTAVTSGDKLVQLFFSGADGTTMPAGAEFRVTSTGTIGTGIVPSRIDLLTATASGVLTVGLTVDETQKVTAANTLAASTVSASSVTATSVAISGNTLTATTGTRSITLDDIGQRTTPYMTQRWYGGLWNTTAGAIVATQARMYAHPEVIDIRVPIDALAFRTATGGVGSEARMAIYDSTGTGGRPGNLIAQTVTGATTTTPGNVILTFSSPPTLDPGAYWIATMHSWTTTAPYCKIPTGISPAQRLAGAASADVALSGSGGFVYADTTYANGFPASFGAATEVAGTNGNTCVSVWRAQ